VTVYETDEGALRPTLPLHCPFGGDGAECRVGAHCRRERLQGPEFALVVAVCHAHRRYFTLYPPGWAPWGRVPIRRAISGEPPARESALFDAEALFDAALDAAAGRLWPVQSMGALGCAKTQLCWIRRCGAWLGIAGSERAAEAAAGVLELPLSMLLDARRGFAGADRRRSGAAVGRLLRHRAWTAADLRRLLVVGGRNGVCGRAWISGSTGVSQPVFPA